MKRTEEEEEEEGEATSKMVSTIFFIQANLQHSTAASGILTRVVRSRVIDIALIQEPWYREGRVWSLNIPGYTLYPTGGKDRPRVCILARNMNLWVLPDFSCRYMVAVLVKYYEEGQREEWYSALRICHMTPRTLLPLRSWRTLCDTVRRRSYIC